ncbi:MAG: hypothetical protein RR579_05775 [Eubacterium sp.]
MDFTMLITAFGGGLLAAAIGGVPSFVFTGLTVLAAVFGGEAGAPMVGFISFGSFFGPHVAFGGAVAAATYAKSKNLLDDGQDIVTPLFKTGDAGVLIVGGVFGIIGYLINYILGGVLGGFIVGALPNGVWHDPAIGFGQGWVDSVAMTVFISGILARLIFTKSGITGKYTGTEKRQYFPTGKRLTFLIVVGLGIGIAIGGVAASLGMTALGTTAAAPFALALFKNIGVIGFGIAAVSLTFLCMGLPLEGYHHIILPAGATAMILFAATINPFVAILGGAVMGIITSLWGEWAGMTFNSYADSHIDPPAATIWVWELVNFTILMSIVAPHPQILALLG